VLLESVVFARSVLKGHFCGHLALFTLALGALEKLVDLLACPDEDDEKLTLFFDREVDETVLATRCPYPLAPQSAVSLEELP